MADERLAPLRDDAVIVRYGLMELDHLREAVQTCNEVRGFPGLSFFGANGLTVEEIAAAARRPHRWLRTSTYGSLRKAGYRLAREGRDNHLVLRFEQVPTDAELRRLVGLFDAPRGNPHPV